MGKCEAKIQPDIFCGKAHSFLFAEQKIPAVVAAFPMIISLPIFVGSEKARKPFPIYKMIKKILLTLGQIAQIAKTIPSKKYRV